MPMGRGRDEARLIGGLVMDLGLIAHVRRLLGLSEQDPDQACAQFDVLVALHGRQELADVLWNVAGEELAELRDSA